MYNIGGAQLRKAQPFYDSLNIYAKNTSVLKIKLRVLC